MSTNNRPNRKLPPLPILLTSLAVAAALLGDAMLYVVMPARPELWHLTIVQVGVLLSVNRLVRLFTNPLSSVLVEKYGIYNPFRISLIASLGVLVAYALSTNFIILLFARLMWGACWSVLRLVSQWVASAQSTKTNLGLNLSSNASIIRVGSIGGAVFGGVFSDYLGYESAFMIFGVLTLISLMIWINKSACKEGIPSDQHEKRSTGFTRVLRDPNVLILSVSSMITGLVFSGLIGATLGHFLRHKYGLEFNVITITVGVATATGFALGLKSFAEVFAGPYGGYISDKYGRLKTLILSSGIFSITLLILGFTYNIYLTFFILILVFITGVVLMMQLLTLVGVVAQTSSRSQVFSVYNTFQDFGSALGPLIGLSLIPVNLLPSLYALSALTLFLLIAGACIYLKQLTRGQHD